jgi:predicted transcriptional regulator
MTTTLKLPPELKTRIARVAKGAGQTPHAFMIEALAHQTEQAERRRRMMADALSARAEFERTGLGYAMQDVHVYFRARMQGKKAAKPRLRQWRR